MKIGLIGLGKMGYNLSLNLMDNHHEVVAYDVNKEAVEKLANEGATGAFTVEELVNELPPSPKVVWIMVPAGEVTENVITELKELLSEGDIIIDGGNSNYKESVRRAQDLQEKGIYFFDVGTSGGMEGARNGACTMIGGDAEVFRTIEPIFNDICVENGFMYAGKSGSGHFLKMVHNGVEYGMMQSIAEGFEVLEKSQFDFDYEAVARVWNNGSVVRSWLMELTENAFSKDPKLDSIKGVMQSSGEGKWTVETALDLQTATPVIALSLMMRYRSLEEDTFTGKVVAALRNEFGGHGVVNK
ncbi:phosphogluconate dehydrogenase (NAD(+)-dependent, decarboxylating) [Priestia megaterium]|jgi:6-phosphogluconate dehydrogenase|uniref:phosphogluconate dehydrogenase (NAD(+)-dependent, decarboxylating) n=1 Tax=Priestia TaxID=2800373 RepID=UPI0005C44D42|nr:decarboxylating 6-phosphogluconate dehydrogenase [Priestia megaterium]MCF8887831.1 decarboxylating 6-phosphogluconate dehydrogenase [Priestia megaterium]MDW4507883.1 decarboxylating 6-phosphogluconate dehydrogenase [Priestia megaterium]MEB2265353.1 decarboxylating 6-phosphogluconate dehydrogenase [Priestia megaterium]NEW00786.1 decarboxylating 6-phosphogluconate dehydrogenase [Priestia megaterium]NGY83235.1 decarboxylating 6-phosphogluconate dehydrogenase [Priestia megaterium]